MKLEVAESLIVYTREAEARQGKGKGAAA